MPHPAIAFAHELGFADLPPAVARQAMQCMLDLVGVAAAGSCTDLSWIIRGHVAEHWAAGRRPARLLFDGRRASPVGAALANGMTIDAIDAHDGHPLTKGHVGCGTLSALLSFAEGERSMCGREFLAALTVGYELGARAGIALHRTAPDYHTSGAWVALACAAIGARVLKLDAAQTRHAVGIAEYHGPRSQMMRCIDWPSMLKDGSGWGAMAGTSAAYLAANGFTGVPAVTIEGNDVGDLWSDLGTRWRIMEQYFKAHPVCRWAQPAVEAALQLARAHGFDAVDVERLEIVTFHEATRLAVREPASTEEAQYSLPFPVAAALVRGTIGPDEISGEGLSDPAVLRLSRSVVLSEEAAYNAKFPAERLAHAIVRLRDGRVLRSEPAVARGSAENPLREAELVAKYRSLTRPVIGVDRSALIEAGIMGLGDDTADVSVLLDDLLGAAAARCAAEAHR